MQLLSSIRQWSGLFTSCALFSRKRGGRPSTGGGTCSGLLSLALLAAASSVAWTQQSQPLPAWAQTPSRDPSAVMRSLGYPTTPPGPVVMPGASASPMPQADGVAQASFEGSASAAPHGSSEYGVSSYDASLAPAGSVPSVEQELAELKARIGTLEKPAPKYPSLPVLSGVFQADIVSFNQDDASRVQLGVIENGADFRRARLGAKAAITNNMNAFMQMDFAFPGRPTFTDLWVEWTDLPLLGNVKVGQWKQPFSLEVVSSFRYTTFMERSLLFIPFTPFRHMGVGFYDHSDDLMSTWAASVIRTGQDQYGDSLSTSGGNGLVSRLTRLAWYDEASDGRSYFHLGGAYFLDVPPRHTRRFRTIPEIFVGEHAGGAVGTAGVALPGAINGTPFFVDTGNITGIDAVHTFGVEAMLVNGPFSLQSEAMAAVVDQEAQDTAMLGGMYVQAGYFLTGEHRPYDRANGAIGQVKPFEEFFRVRTSEGIEHGKGAWEVACRWSYIDLSDANINGGSMHDLTAGLNWYSNANCKVVVNYIHSWLTSANGVESETSALGVRTQVDF